MGSLLHVILQLYFLYFPEHLLLPTIIYSNALI